MRHDKFLLAFLFLMLVGALIYGAESRSYMQGNTSGIQLTVGTDKKVYVLGEVVSLDLELKNTGLDLKISGGVGPAEIYVSQNGQPFQECTNTERKMVDAKRSPIKLATNESVLNTEKILRNSDTSSLDKTRPWKEGRVKTQYVFPSAGAYRIKAKYAIYLSKDPVWIESEPIEITINEPKGEELEVWNRIKDKGDIAYLLQENEFHIPSYKSEERTKLGQEIEKIIRDYPNSFYSQNLRESMEKFRMSEAKREEFKQSLQKQNPN